MFGREFPPPVALIPDAKPDWKLDPGFAIEEAADDEDGTEGAEGIDDAAEVGIDDEDDPMLLDGGLNAEPSPDIPEPPPPLLPPLELAPPMEPAPDMAWLMGNGCVPGGVPDPSVRPALAAFTAGSPPTGTSGPSALWAFIGFVSLPFLAPSASAPSSGLSFASGSTLLASDGFDGSSPVRFPSLSAGVFGTSSGIVKFAAWMAVVAFWTASDVSVSASPL